MLNYLGTRNVSVAQQGRASLLSTEYNLKKPSKSPNTSHNLATQKTNKNLKSDHKVTQTNKKFNNMWV